MVDFSKMLAERKAQTEDETSLTIYTADGQEIALPEGASLLDFMPKPSGGGGGRIPRLGIGQPSDNRLEGIAGKVGDTRIPPPQFFLTVRTRDGQDTKVSYRGPFGSELDAVPIGI